MHLPCPDCTTGWLMPEVGHSHLRHCPTCQGTGYITACSSTEERDASGQGDEVDALGGRIKSSPLQSDGASGPC